MRPEPRAAAATPAAAPAQAPWPGGASIAAAVALTLAFRALYLARWGGDPCWMNQNFLLDAKAMRFGYAAEYYGMPLVRGALYALRSAGASAEVALGALYLAGHALLALGLLALGSAVLSPTRRSFAALALAIAVLPAFATDAGYRNVSCTLAVGLFTAAAALLVDARARRSPARLGTAFVLAALAACCRPESALAVGALAAALAIAGPRLGSGRVGALAAAAGLAAGLLVVRASQHAAPNAALSADVWAFYTFYEASPLAWRAWTFLHDPGAVADEYARYVHTAGIFGGFVENGGSIARALLRHPAQAALWLALKPIDLLATILLPDAFTPLALVAFFLAARRLRREGWRAAGRGWAALLCAFGAPLLFLLAWSQGHAPYLLIAAPLLLLAALWGLEPWIARVAPRTARAGGWAVAGVTALAVAVAGQVSSASTAPPLRAAARWLEVRCAATGCLVNSLPTPIDAVAWADLQAGARMPLKDKRAEAFVLKRYPPAWLAGVRWDARVAAARAAGWTGPVLYVRTAVRSMAPYSDVFDPEHRLEGEPDLARAARAATFQEGSDRVDVFELAVAAAAQQP